MKNQLQTKSEKIFSILNKIPKGKVTTYKILAEKINSHPRAIGKILNSNPYPIKVPCHRVIMSSGKLGGYVSGIEKKTSLLRHEGLHITNGKIDLKRYLYTPN